MDLNQVTLPALDLRDSADFYTRMGFPQIVDSLSNSSLSIARGYGARQSSSTRPATGSACTGPATTASTLRGGWPRRSLRFAGRGSPTRRAP